MSKICLECILPQCFTRVGDTDSRIIHRADLFLDELQAGLNSIRIQGDNIEELWCMLDWHSYILKLWVKHTTENHKKFGRKWMFIVEIWHHIIEATVELVIKYGHASGRPPRSSVPGRKNYLTFLTLHFPMSDDECLISKSIVDRSDEHDWDASLLDSKKSFEEMILNVKNSIACNRSKEELEWGIESIEFLDYIEEVEENIRKLMSLLSAEEMEKLYLVIVRALELTLQRWDVRYSIGYLQVIQTLRSKWFSKMSKLIKDLDWLHQNRVQGLFTLIITGSSYERAFALNEHDELTAKDLADVIALGADLRGETCSIDSRKDCCLWEAAASQCSIGVFKALVKAGAPYNRNKSGLYATSPLQAAVEAGRIDILRFLLDSTLHSLKLNVNDSDLRFRTALHVAAETCNKKAVGLLLQHPDIEADVMDYDYTPFLLAVKARVDCQDKRAVVQSFINIKRGDSFRLSRAEENALHLAADFRDATLSILIRHVRDVDAQDWKGDTPLHRAVRAKSKPNVEILLRHGADPTIANERGYTPLQLACDERHLGPMEALLSLPRSLVDQWPDTTGINFRGSGVTSSPITQIFRDFVSTTRIKKVEHARRALKLVLAVRPDLEARDSSGQSILSQMIIRLDCNDIILDLLRAGADVNSQDNKGNTILHILFSRIPIEYKKLKLLLKWGANPDVNNKNGQNPIAANSMPHRVEKWEKDVAAIIKRHKAEIAEAQRKDKGPKTEARPQKPRPQDVKKPSVQSMSNPFSILMDNEES